MLEHSESKTTALIVGAGPVGLVMASELARRGIACRIIDKALHASTTSKALGIQSRTLEVFQRMGIVTEMLEQGRKAKAFNFYANGHLLTRLDLNQIEGLYSFILVLPQSETEHILTAHLEQLGTHVERSVELLDFTQDEQGVTATLHHSNGQTETVAASWLLGCDGAHSDIRHLLNLRFTGSAFQEGFALADVHLKWSLPNDQLHLFLHPHGLLAIFPLPDNKYRLIVDISDPTQNALNFTLEDFQHFVHERGPSDAVVHDATWISPFHIQERVVNQYRQGRVFLAGDAAHIHSPAGGQGMNTGIQDAFNLTWKLALVEQGYAPSSLLDTYHVERSPIAKGVIQTSDLLLRVNTLHNPLVQQIRNRLLSLVAQQRGFQQRFVGQISELAINYHRSPIVSEYQEGIIGHAHFQCAPKAGNRVPEVKGLKQGDGTISLFEALQGTNHTLLLLTGTKPHARVWKHLDALSHIISDRYGDVITVYIVTAEDVVPSYISPMVLLHDPHSTLHKRFGADRESLYLIRPDAYIGFRSQPIVNEPLWNYLQMTFITTS